MPSPPGARDRVVATGAVMCVTSSCAESELHPHPGPVSARPTV